MITGVSNVIKLNGQSCSSEGYRMAETQSECQDIARRLGLSDTTLQDWGTVHDCYGQGSYRCEYDNLSNDLYWNPHCNDNTESTDNGENLCTSGIWKKVKIIFVMI